jgi:hypothetical protein
MSEIIIAKNEVVGASNLYFRLLAHLPHVLP